MERFQSVFQFLAIVAGLSVLILTGCAGSNPLSIRWAAWKQPPNPST